MRREKEVRHCEEKSVRMFNSAEEEENNNTSAVTLISWINLISGCLFV